MPVVARSRPEEMHVDQLPSIASSAAVALDDLLINKPGVHLAAVRELAHALASWVYSEGTGSAALQLDPGRVFVINRAFGEASGLQQPDTVDDLVRETRVVTRLLEDVNEHSRDAEQLKRLRGFCLALSRRAASFVHSGDDSELRHPFRR